ncbi:MAG: nucleotidyltransferase domain-containing protein [Formivibrio sp.]|nr:nucleotidyltransferase domain-containing protein [Formivibrio sp.]
MSDSRFESLQKCLDGNPQVILAVVVGSRADGLAREDSDWDLAILTDPSLPAMARFDELQRLQWSLAAEAGIPVERLDLIDLSAAGLAMREQVANHGLLLKGENTLAWSHFLVRTWRELEEFTWEQQHAA